LKEQDLHFKMLYIVFLEKNISRCYITSNVGQNRVFDTFRLGYLKILTCYSNSGAGFGFSVEKSTGNHISFACVKKKRFSVTLCYDWLWFILRYNIRIRHTTYCRISLLQ